MGPLKSRSHQQFTSHAAMCEKTTRQLPDLRHQTKGSLCSTVHLRTCMKIQNLSCAPRRRSTPPPNAVFSPCGRKTKAELVV